MDEAELLFQGDRIIWSSPKNLDDISNYNQDYQACSKLNTDCEQNTRPWEIFETPACLSSNDDKIKILSSGNGTDSTKTIEKSCKEEELKSTETCKRSIMDLNSFHNPVSYTTASNKLKRERKLNERQDVINKALLRSIKRFYFEEFRKDNKDLIKKRYKQVPSKVVLNGFKKTCLRLFGDIPNLSQISQFIMILSAISPMDKYSYDKSILTKAEQVCAAMYKYSSIKFKKLFNIEELEFIFCYIYNNHRDRIFKLWTKKEIENKEPYNQMLDTWIAKFIECRSNQINLNSWL